MPAIAKKNNTLIYKGSNFLRQRLILSVLSGKPVRIIEIRTLLDEPGLQEFEINLIRLLDKLTNGTTIDVNETGTALFFQPGLLHGGDIDHECCTARSIGYYLEVLLMVGLFCKVPLNAVLRGVTANNIDPSVDHVKLSMISTLKKFILEDSDLELKITKRGMPPGGGGEVILKCPIRKQLRPVQLIDAGMVKRIRGIAYALRVSPAIANRMVDTAKGVLLKFIPDVYINTDQCKGKASGKSPGFGIHLYAETTTGVVYSAEQVSNDVTKGDEPSVPEDVGIAAAQQLLQSIYLGGFTDAASQSLAILCMALGQKDVSKIILGPLSEYTIGFLQNLHEFFGMTVKLENYLGADEDEPVAGANKVSLTCVGIGYTNLSKATI